MTLLEFIMLLPKEYRELLFASLDDGLDLATAIGGVASSMAIFDPEQVSSMKAAIHKQMRGEDD